MAGKQTYYLALGTGQISQSSTAFPWNFKVEATDEEISELRGLFNQNYSTEWKNFVRAHIPFVEYHQDKENDEYDATMKKVYEKIYELGDEETKEHIHSMGILQDDSF